MEVGKDGKGRPNVVENFIAEAEERSKGGVAEFATTKDGLSLLHIAAKNKHSQCIKSLAAAAARGVASADENSKFIDVNVKTKGVGTSGNSPLHLAVMTGVDGLETVEALLDVGANIRQKNVKNATPYDLAVKSGCEQMWTLLAAKEGQKMLDKLTKASNNEKLKVEV